MIITTRRALAAFAASSAALLAFAATAPAAAQTAEYKAVELKNLENGKHQLSDDKGYIYIRSTRYRSQGVFIKTPDADEVAEFEAEWREEFDEAVEKYPKRLERWRSGQTSRGSSKPRPEEPTEETFSIGSIETRMLVSFGPQFVFAKGKDASGEKYFEYLIEVEPGEYTYYGPLFMGPNGPVGSCYCMGTVKFAVEAGNIASLGDFLQGDWVTPEAMSQASIFASSVPERSGRPADYTVPQSLSALPSAPADLYAAGKINNFYRAGVGRMPPVEGVLAYERDIVIDVKAEIAAAKAKAEAERLAREAAEAKAREEAAAAAAAVAEAADAAAQATSDAEAVPGDAAASDTASQN